MDFVHTLGRRVRALVCPLPPRRQAER